MEHTMAIRTIIVDLKHESIKSSSYLNTYGGFHGPERPYNSDLIFDTEHKCVNEHESIHWKVESDSTEYIGMVVSVETTCDQIMSDVWENVTRAVVYDTQSGGFKKVIVSDTNSKRIITYEIDASETLKEAYNVWCIAKKYARSLAEYDRYQEKLYQERITPNNGKWVVVTRGRKVPKGTQGIVFWTGKDNYNKTKLGIAVTNRKENNRYVDVVWTAAANCDVTNIPCF
jgi:hypothetical protein